MKIAIIGSGISGLSLAYLLNPYYDVRVFEKNDYLGGHSRTIEVDVGDNIVPVDTGFIVFNYRNYPHLAAMFQHLKIPVVKSDMSFGVSINHGWLEYGTKNLVDIFAQKCNLLRLPFWYMLYDILKFNRRAASFLKTSSDLCLQDCLDQIGLRDWFRRYYLLAMGSAIWSTPLSDMLRFPAHTFLRFFENHGLLSVTDQPQWYSVSGGSREYVKKLSQPFLHKIQLNCGVKKLIRKPDGLMLEDRQGQRYHFDHLVFACHSDQALAILAEPSTMERAVLGSIRYQPNQVILHSDTRFMPKRRQAWSSWNYLADEPHSNQNNKVSLSYWMNNLQSLDTDKPILVTLNPGRPVDSKKVYDRCSLSHPVFDKQAIQAQNNLDAIQGQLNTWYCGAWTQYGFHEDGLQSGVNVATAMGVKIPWT